MEGKTGKEHLSAEYLRISEQVAASSARQWQAAAFLVGGAFAAAGLVLMRGQHGIGPSIQTVVLGIGISILLFLFRKWFIKRERWRIEILYIREKEIEEELGFYAGRYVLWLDKYKKDGELPCEVPPEKRDFLENLHKKSPSPGIVGWRFIKWLTWGGIGVWIALIVMEALFLFGCR